MSHQYVLAVVPSDNWEAALEALLAPYGVEVPVVCGSDYETYNPNAEWDWWVIGGRWAGKLGGYDVRDYPENFETCRVCEGTGFRPNGAEQFGEDWVRQMNGCNGCLGEGTHLVWDNFYVPEDGNKQEVEILLGLDDQKFEDRVVPAALVTPNEGWLGATEKNWAETVRSILSNYKDHLAVVVDCHF